MKEEKVLENATVCFLFKENKVLLALKTRKIGEGFWNGYGGGIEKGETQEEGAIRELKEETGGVIAKDLEKIAIIDFHNKKSDKQEFVCRVHFYLVREWVGEVKEVKEMINPTWFDIENLPLDKMMPADREFLPIALRGQKVIGKAYLGPFQKKSLKPVEIEYVDSFPAE